MDTPAEDGVESTLTHILEDLRFYAEMNLTVKAIRLGASVWDDLRNCRVQLVVDPGYSVADSFPKLFGIPVIVLRYGNPWARGYTFAETNASVFNVSRKDVSQFSKLFGIPVIVLTDE